MHVQGWLWEGLDSSKRAVPYNLSWTQQQGCKQSTRKLFLRRPVLMVTTYQQSLQLTPWLNSVWVTRVIEPIDSAYQSVCDESAGCAVQLCKAKLDQTVHKHFSLRGGHALQLKILQFELRSTNIDMQELGQAFVQLFKRQLAGRPPVEHTSSMDKACQSNMASVAAVEAKHGGNWYSHMMHVQTTQIFTYLPVGSPELLLP
eukprot:29023-Chlamydomonas_euryale.AAC.11